VRRRAFDVRPALPVTLTILLLAGCASPAPRQWTQAGKDQQAFYRDDAACLAMANETLFAQADEIRASRVAATNGEAERNTACLSLEAGRMLYRGCMEERGWREE